MQSGRPNQSDLLYSLNKFKQVVGKLVSIPEDEWEFVTPLLHTEVFEKKEYLARAGDVVNNFYFIVKGLVRFFYSTSDGREFNKHFALENGFAGSFHSLVMNQPCGFYLQALEKTSTLVLPNQLLYQLYDRNPCWERLLRKNAETQVMVKEVRERALLLDSLETRYLSFLQEFPNLIDRIPQYHIASYLGVTDVALSRVRRKINLG